MSLLSLLVTGEATSIECREEVHDGSDKQITDALAGTIWSHPGMSTYYRNARGRIVIPMPWTNVDYWHMTHEVDRNDFHLASDRENALG
jgi:4-hydroxyacetophenone monooxygenase